MKNFKWLILIGISCILLFSLLLPACTAKETAPSPTPAPTIEKDKEWPSIVKFFSVGTTASTYVMSVPCTEIINKCVGVDATIVPGTGSTAAVPLFQKGELDFHWMADYNSLQGRHGVLGYEDVGKGNWLYAIRGFPKNYICYSRPDKQGIKTISDAKGETIPVYNPGNMWGNVITETILNEYGVTKDNSTFTTFSSSKEKSGDLISGKVCCYFFPPSRSQVEEIRQSCGFYGAAIGEKQAENICDKLNEMMVVKGQKLDLYYPAVLVGEKFGITKEEGGDLGNIGWDASLVVREGLPDDLVSKFLECFFEPENLKLFQGSYPDAKYVTLDNACRDAFIPFHPGAIKFYKDKGLWTPEMEKQQQAAWAREK